MTKKEKLENEKAKFGLRSGKDWDYAPIKTQKDIEDQRYAMAVRNGKYPLSISDCEVIGINGDCGLNCPVFLAGKCDTPPVN